MTMQQPDTESNTAPSKGTPFERPYFLHYYDCDWQRRHSIFSMLRFFEDIAMHQSEGRGIGLDYYEQQGVAWMLTQYDVSIHHAATLCSTVMVRTRPLAFRGMLATRSFAIYDEQDRCCVEAMSHWVFMDTRRRRPQRIPREMFNGYGIDRESADLVLPPALPLVTEAMDEREFTVRLSDIDLNGHVNNIHYVEWALEALPERLRREGMLKEILVQFRRETHYGGNVTVRGSWKEQGDTLEALHSIAAGDQDLCRVRTRWSLPADALSS